MTEAHKSASLDFGDEGDSSNESHAAASETASETPTEASAKSESAKSEKKESPKPPSPSQRELAADFKDRMDKRRNSKKTKRQAEKPGGKRHKEFAVTIPRKRSRRTTKKPKFPYPLGTIVARDFDGKVFTGKITKLYDDDPKLCQVTYSDGDHEDFDAEQVTYGSALYVRDVGESLKKS